MLPVARTLHLLTAEFHMPTAVTRRDAKNIYKVEGRREESAVDGGCA